MSLVACAESVNENCKGTVYIPDAMRPGVYPVFCDNEAEPHNFCVEVTDGRPPRGYRCDPLTRKEVK